MKKTILYIESVVGEKDKIWGSLTSLSGLLERLDLRKYAAKLIVYYKSDSFNELEKLGVKVIYLSIPIKERSDSSLKKKIGKTSVGDYLKNSVLNELRREVVVFFKKTLPTALNIYKIIKREKPDLVHCNNGLKINISAIIAAKLARKHCICHERGIFHINPLERMIARFVNLFICNSNAVRDNYLKQGFNKDKIRVIHNGVDLRKYSPSRCTSNEGSRISIISIGRLIEWKGHHVFIKAAPEVLKIYPTVKFILVGSGNYENELRILTNSLGIEDAVVFAGYLKDVRNALDKSDIFVHCSIKPEPFGRTIIEAMAMGKATIASNLGAVPEIITDGVDGILIPPEDPEILSKTIIHLLENDGSRRKLGAAARKKVVEKFDIESNVIKTVRIYEELLKN